MKEVDNLNVAGVSDLVITEDSLSLHSIQTGTLYIYTGCYMYIHTYMYVPACPNVRPSFYDAGPLGCVALCILGQVKLLS